MTSLLTRDDGMSLTIEEASKKRQDCHGQITFEISWSIAWLIYIGANANTSR